ncbi:integrase core domain-containing protein [Oceanithermus sp.]
MTFLLSALRHYRRLGIRPKTTPPYAPRTSGKAERFIRTLLNEWAYAHAYRSSDERNAHLPEWLHLYNGHRPHTSLKNKAPISRLGLRVNKMVRLHS